MEPKQCLAEILISRSNCSNKGVTLIGGGQSEFLSYKVLHGRALGGLCALASRGIEAPTPLVMMVSPARDFLTAFWAAQLGGMVPVPVSMGQKPEHLRRLTRIMEYFPTAPILAPEGYRPFFASCGLLSRFIAYESLKLSEDAVPVVSPGSTGLIQFSSGSTGAPTGVILSQKNLVSNIVHISKKIEYLGDDSTSLSWMPLSHDMGLIGMHLVPLLLGWSQVLMDPAVFLEEPIRWLEALEQNKVTVTASPNFGLGYTLSRLGEPGFSAYDLSCLRLLINGAEPISPSVCRSFSLELSRAGCPTNPMVPVYGLAQATLAVTFSKPENPLGSLSLDRDALSRGEAVLSRDESALELVSLGKPLENTEVIIVDPEARLVSPLPEEVVGEVRVRGESVAIDQVGGELPVEQGWLCTGDMGFLHHGELYITGRTKDIFIYGGQNYYLNDFERILEEKGGVPPGQVACAVLPPQDGGEECMVVFREKYLRRVAETSGMSMEQAMQAQGQLFSTLLGREAGVPLKKGAIMQSFPKTTSGKLQRFLLTQAVLNNEIPLVIFKEKIKESDWLVALWDETLPPREGGHVTDPDASYFDLGGDSLSLARLLGKITNRVGVRVSFSAFYSRPTLRVLTELVSGAPHRESEGTGVTNDGVLALPGPARRIFIAQSLINLSERYDSLTYNLPQLIGIRGALDVERLSDAFADLFARHPVLSSYVGFEGGEATLMRGPVEPFRLAREEGCAREVGDRFNDFVRPFNIGKGPLIRLRLVSQDEQNHWLFLDIHHCIIDGISLGILLLELLERYMGRVLPQPTADYSAYTRWFHGQKTLASYQSQGEYWRALLTEPMDSLTFPVNPQGWERGVWRSEGLLPLSLMQQFRNMKETTGVSDTALLLSLVALYLYRVTGVEQFLMGLVVSGREAGFTGTVGNLINLVPVVCRPAQTRTVKELALTIHGTLAGALENQQYQYESLMRHRKGGTSLFDVVCIYQNFINLGEPVHVMGESLGNLPFQLSLERFSTGLMGGDLSFEFIPRGDELVIRSEVSREIAPEFSLALIPTFIALCEEAVKKEMPLEQFQFGDIPKSMAPGKVTAAGAQPPSLVERLVHTAKNNIHKPAVITEDQAWTYGELFRRAESSVAELAKYSALIIESGDVIHRLSLMLGSLMARVPFAILDPGLPLARRERLLRIFPGAPVLCEGNAVWSADDWSFFLESSDTSGRPGPGGSGGVLVFTSGTTGEARAVLVSHENIAHYMDAFFQVVALGTSHVIGTSSSFMVDISFEAFFGAFLSGAALFVPSRESVLDVVRMERQMERLGVTHLTTTPTWFSHFNGRSPSLTGRTFILGGEVLRLEHIDNVLENNIVFNSYGPTETTVACAYHRVSPDDPALIPLGLPLPGYEVSVRRFGKRQPAGIPGEICVGGSGITPGYVSGGSLTGLPLQKDETSGASYYGTGDLGYFDQTGMIHFSGRQDRQVKLSGYRVELGEIESALRSIPGVTAATVLLDTTKKLTARLNATDDFSMEAFVTSSRSLLPPYMIPRSIILNGEMQKEKPEGEENLPGECGEILPMYEQVLGRTITPETDFFEAGGDSLGIMELYGLLREHWELTLEDLFVYPTPRALSVRMKKTESPDFRGLIQKIFSQGPALMEKHVSNPPYVFSPFEVTTLLITGATGFLGSYLVREFLEQTDAHLILGVRGSMETIYHRIRERLDFYFSAGFFDEYAHRITMVPMDLTQPYCGLSLNEFKHLSNSCDAVIHAAALVKHVGLLSGFMEVNVTGTQTLLQITDFNPDCFFLHISTASLGGSRESESNPYLVTKRMSEEIIFDSESRARCSICRVGNVVFESGTGRFQKNIHENAFYLFLKLMVESGFMFDYQGEILDFSFVDQVARGIRLLLQTAEFQGRDCTLLNSEHLSPSGFVSLMNRGRDRIRLLSPDDFLREIDSLSPESRNRFRLILENLVHFYPTPDPRFPLADPWLSALGAPFESVEVSHIERMLDYCRTTGFIGEIQ